MSSSRPAARAFICLSLCLMTTPAQGQLLSEAQAQAVAAEVSWAAQSLETLRVFKPNAELPSELSAEQSEELLVELWAAYKSGVSAAKTEVDTALGELPPTLAELKEQAVKGKIDIKARRLPAGEHVMPFTLVRRDPKDLPATGRSLFICMHGGGQKGDVAGPHAWEVNNREFEVQTTFAIRVYGPSGLYFVPRMADDRLGRWWHNHNQDAFEQMIRHGLVFWGVDPDRVYLLGISEGGYGTDILAPFMPDLFAGANPMAAGVGLGNPAENLRNLPFRTEVGADDTTYDRVGLARTFHTRLDELRKDDPEGYKHLINCQPGRGHGIDYRPGVEWIAKFRREARPRTVVWTSKPLHGRRRPSLYWVELSGDELEGTISIKATIDREKNLVTMTAVQVGKKEFKGNPSHLEKGEEERTPLVGATIGVLLDDELLDLEQPVRVICNGKEAFKGAVERDGATLLETLVRRGDPKMAFPVRIPITLK